MVVGRSAAGRLEDEFISRSVDHVAFRPWDVCAGSIIAQEAGCFVAGAHGTPFDNVASEAWLTGRKHFVLRAIGDTEAGFLQICLDTFYTRLTRTCPFQAEKGVDAQRRLAKEFYETVQDVEAH